LHNKRNWLLNSNWETLINPTQRLKKMQLVIRKNKILIKKSPLQFLMI